MSYDEQRISDQIDGGLYAQEQLFLASVIYSAFQIGEQAIVFDCNTWLKSGDVGNNEKYYIKAKVIRVRKSKEYPYEWLADVKFEDGRVSRGHFQSGMRHCI